MSRAHPRPRQDCDAFKPIPGQFVADIVLQKFRPLDAGVFGQPQQPALLADQAAVDLVELLDQLLDAHVVKSYPFDLPDHFALELVVAALGHAGQRLALAQSVDALVLQLLELLVQFGDGVEDRQYARLQLGLHRGQRNRAFLALGLLAGEIAVNLGEIACLALRVLPGSDFLFGFDGRGRRRRNHGRRRLLEPAAAISGVEIDDVAQQQPVLVQCLAPGDDRADCQRIFANPADHHLAPGLDPLGDGDLALARQQFDRAHLAQIHAHRIVGAADIVVVEIASRLAVGSVSFGCGRLLALLALDNVDAQFGQHRHRVLDLLRRHLIGWQGGVQFVIGQVAALLDRGPASS